MRIDFQIALLRKPRIMDTRVLSWDPESPYVSVLVLSWPAAIRYLICHMRPGRGLLVSFGVALDEWNATKLSLAPRLCCKVEELRKNKLGAEWLTVVPRLACLVSAGISQGPGCWWEKHPFEHCSLLARPSQGFLTFSQVIKQVPERQSGCMCRNVVRGGKLSGYPRVSQIYILLTSYATFLFVLPYLYCLYSDLLNTLL